jgi:two-component system CheB/CheR fusion protein
MAKKAGGESAPRTVTRTAAALGAASAFPIVGVGASAGGLEAFTQLLEHLPATSGMAYVLIQHLDPTHASQLPEILSRKSAMPVSEIRGETRVEANHVYVIAASENLRIEKGILQPVARPTETGVRNMVIDDFFESLALDRGNLAFGIVLSGTASDGTLGLRAIKSEGGITFAQEPGTAKFDGMPSSAIAAGAVDFVLPPEGIAKQLLALAGHPYLNHRGEQPAEAEKAAAEGDLNPIFGVLRAATGIDFTYYKHNTILRRIERRMALHGIDGLNEYSRKLRHDRGEAKILAQEFLINVTAFFREPETYRVLHDVVFPTLIEGRAADEPIRIWIPGCSTGEEAYSLAMALTEFLEENDASFGMQIFATDLSDPVIERARSGVYMDNALGGVSAERLRRFFVKRDRIYQVSPAIRGVCVFARQNLTKDPPFSKIDLISCCNLLIYLGPVLQKKAISLFDYALKPGGFLVLGSSESVGTYGDSFEVVDRKQRIYSKKRNAVHHSWEEISAGSPGLGLSVPQSGAENSSPLKNIQKFVDRMLLAEYAPAGVIVDDALHVLQVRGETSHYLQIPPGEPTTDLTRMVRPGLLAALRSAIRKARQQGIQVKETGLRVQGAGEARSVDLRVSPIRDPNSKEPCFLILFDEAARRKTPAAKKTAKSPLRAAEEVARLEEELRATRDYLQSIIESQEASAEELRSANEEAQATNEELDTAKEELQASNEELNTVNDELRARNLEQSTLNSDLRKLLGSINVPLVMVGKDLLIRWFTPAMEPLLNLLPTDQGRPITDLHSGRIPNFRELLVAALTGEESQSIEIESPTGRWLSLRILPYRGTDHSVDGAIATLIDIDDLKRARDLAEAVVGVVREPLIVLDAGLRVRTANPAFYAMFQLESQDTEGRLIYEIGGGQWNHSRLRQLLEDVLPKRSWMRDFEVEQDYKGIGVKKMLLHAREIRQGDGERMILLAIDDVTVEVAAKGG